MKSIRHRTILALAVLAIPALAFAQNQPPVADAGPDQNLYTEQGLILPGSASDPDGDVILAWAWQDVSAPAGATWSLSSDNTPTPTFIGYTPGDYVFSLVVVDSRGALSGPDYVTIHVVENQPPVAIATADKATVVLGETVTFDGSQSYDPERGALDYLWEFVDGSAPLEDVVSPTHAFNFVGIYSVRLWVTDVRGAYDMQPVTITVVPPLSVASAAVRWAKKGALASVDVEAEFTPFSSGIVGDPFSMSFDGISLFSAPRSAFMRDPATGIYSYLNSQTSVSIDFASGTISVHNGKAPMTGFDASDGVDVVLAFGVFPTGENITMTTARGGRLVYERAITP